MLSDIGPESDIRRRKLAGLLVFALAASPGPERPRDLHSVGGPDRERPPGGEPAIHRDVLAGDKASGVAREEGRNLRDILRQPRPRHGLNPGQQPLEHTADCLDCPVCRCTALPGGFGEDAGEDRSGRDAVRSEMMASCLPISGASPKF